MTSMIRSALTSARGTSMNMKVAIMTDMRICSQVGEERGQRPDLHDAVGDQVPAEPDDGSGGQVQ